ncbi:perilipin-5 [Vombatus ursinus]|uniref:Perilipin-5 n=1 Tax=Vombatus ursinus TaxID=29139 RepID=A0A4X2M388_VOMUR|nr:perilipin-5 [Vombatus ursinus]
MEVGDPSGGARQDDFLATMSEEEQQLGPAPVEEKQQSQAQAKNLMSRVASLPLVSTTYARALALYSSVKENHPYLNSLCGLAERSLQGLTTRAARGAQPILSLLEPQITSVNTYACKGLDKLEEKLPFLRQPSQEVVTSAKDAVTSSVTGVVGLAQKGRRWSVDLTRSVVTSGVDTVMGMGQMVTNGVDAMLGKSEELMDHFLPMTDEELDELAAAAAEGGALAPGEDQHGTSYFVRLGSLSSRLQQRVYQHSLGRLRQKKHQAQESFTQLHDTLEMIHHMKHGSNHNFQGGQGRLKQLWQDWSHQDKECHQSQVESQTLDLSRDLTQELQATCETLAASVQGLPPAVQAKVLEVQQSVEELHQAFSAARSFHDLPLAVLAKGRGHMAQAHTTVDELLDFVLQSIPLPWLVGPFSPLIVERPCTPQELIDQVDEVVGGNRSSLLEDRWANMDWVAQQEAWRAAQEAAVAEEVEPPVIPSQEVKKATIMPELDF